MTNKNLGNNILWNFTQSQQDTPAPAVTTAKQSYLLINEPGDSVDQVRFGQSSSDDIVYLDWDLDGHGFTRKTQGDDAKAQATLKMLFTEKQPNGYGAHLYNYIGIKDVGARRLSMFMDISMAILQLMANLNSEASRQGLSADDLIATVTGLSISEDETDNRAVRVKVSFPSTAGALNLNVL
jgi:hypothetical protein